MWGIYLVILEKQDSVPKGYLGSETNAVHCIKERLRHDDIGYKMSDGIEDALYKGYAKTSKVLLCWTPLPTIEILAKLRVVLL